MLRSLSEIESRKEPWTRLLTWAHDRKISEYPWKKMQVGDAFRFGLISENAARNVASRAGARLDRRFAVVKMGVKLYCFRVDYEWVDKLRALRETKYPWRTLEVGKGFRADDVTEHSRRTMAKAASERYGKEFKVQGKMIRRVR